MPTGRVAVVTGGSSGIGLGIVRGLLDAGALVAFCGTSNERISASMTELAAGDRVMAEIADVADPVSVSAFFATVRQRLGDVDILVNNAGVSPKRRSPDPWATQVTLEEWRRVLDVNLTGAWLCSQEVIPGMIARRWGRIINIGSIAGRTTPKIAGPHYAAAKAGLGGLTRSLAFDLGPHGITVNCLAPGWIASNMTAPVGSSRAEEAAAAIPVRRVGIPSDMAAAVTFLAGDAASYLTGTTIDVNGGAFAI
ncbi:MAG: SDR family oxidoreductase [Alphaproteobacteria bacterium]|nr:SDR family oxidoreductase [Alphaproteobacteria bacterium]